LKSVQYEGYGLLCCDVIHIFKWFLLSLYLFARPPTLKLEAAGSLQNVATQSIKLHTITFQINVTLISNSARTSNLKPHTRETHNYILASVHYAGPSDRAYVCGRSPAEIVGSNPTGGMDVCLLWVLCVVR